MTISSKAESHCRIFILDATPIVGLLLLLLLNILDILYSLNDSK